MSPNYVFVIDKDKTPLTPTHPAKARKLLNQGRAAVFRLFPFTIVLKRKVTDVKETKFQLKIDPGSKTTGLAIVKNNLVLWAAELTHRGEQIKLRLEKRRAVRRSRRNRKTRYRKARFQNRRRKEGWLAPSLMHRVLTTMTWVKRLAKYCPINGISQELIKFDTQAMVNPEINGIQYQQGELMGYEIREYLLFKWQRKCAYCNGENVPLEIEHIIPKSKGGTNRVSNLTLACHPCNQKKGNQNVKDFLHRKLELLKKILSQAKAPLKDAAAVNSTRWKLYNSLKETELPVETGSGGLTKYNRCHFGLPKTHWLDAACVGKTPKLKVLTNQPLLISAIGNCNRLVIQMDKFGFPRKGYKPKQKVQNWNTGDYVNVIAGKQEGLRNVRLKTVRAKGNFDIKLSNKKIVSVSRNHIKTVHKSDGYSYSFG
ncbi:MAG: RNA-guided endonuclease IscB [Xenococcaceae cyanobacterium]